MDRASVPGRARPSWLAVVIAAAGLGLVFVVARDGSPAWQLVRGVGAVLWALAMGWAVRGDRHPGKALAAVAGGVAGLAVGIGIAVPHVTKVGLTTMSVAGVALLAGAGAVALDGALGLIRGVRRRTRFAVVPALSVLAVLVVWCLGIAVAATNVPRTSVGALPPALADLGAEEVAFAADDGVRLSGWYVPSTTGAAVVLLHGAGSTRSGATAHARLLARHGYGVLLFDARGHGRSGGRAMDLGWYGDADTAAAVSFVSQRPDVDAGRIAAVGLSMGGEEALGAAAGDDRIRAVVAEGATGRTVADKAWLSEVHGWRGAVQEGIDHLLYGAVDLLTSSGPPVSLRAAVAAAAPRPVLLIAAGDVPEEGDAGRYIRAGSPGSVELWIVDDAGHTGGLRVQPDEWERRVVGFLERAIGPAA